MIVLFTLRTTHTHATTTLLLTLLLLLPRLLLLLLLLGGGTINRRAGRGKGVRAKGVGEQLRLPEYCLLLD